MQRFRSFNMTIFVFAVVGGIVSGALLPLSLHEARGATSSNYPQQIGTGGDLFYNYDFGSQTVAQNNVDWPMTILFIDNAEIDRIKGFYASWGYNAIGSSQYARMKDVSTWGWDDDRGLKSAWCSYWGSSTAHMRLYSEGAPPDPDQMYTPAWGFYIVASTHKDVSECAGSAQFGWSESLESEFVNAASNNGLSVIHNWGQFYNSEPSRWEGNHFWNNNGYASLVYIP